VSDALDPYVSNETIKASLKKLLDDLVADYPIEDRERLTAVIWRASLPYLSNRRWPPRADTLHEMAEPLEHVLSLLENDTNFSRLCIALANDDDKLAREGDRIMELIRYLKRIQRVVPPPPAKRPKGRPLKSSDLYALVDSLASYWEETTGQPFAQSWHTNPDGRREPIANAARFVYAVVEFIDDTRLRALPKVTAKIVSERRAPSSRK
jgi:hypothetical protein